MKIADIVQGKRILIWGYGLEGRSMESFLKRHCEPASVEIYQGSQDGIREEEYDLILKSPGIRETRYNEKYSSMTELFLQEFSHKTIGVTGTKGKSTTASLLYEALKACKKEVVLLGNIGIPCLDRYEEITPDSIIVFELSCHQLDHLRVSPHIALFLNLYEEHLDHYDTLERYFGAKANITLHQSPGDHLFCGANVPEMETAAVRHLLPERSPNTYALKVKGEHNQLNAYAAECVLKECFSCAEKDIRRGLESFSGLRHRLEYLGNVDGVDYYDDSISTIPAATIAALSSIPNAKTVLIGGMDRHIDYHMLTEFIPKHTQYNYILMYESGERIHKSLSGLACCHLRKDLREAVTLSRELTGPGEAVVLSPAAASYGYFKNFEERGDVFRRLVGLCPIKDSRITFTGDIGFDHYMDQKWEDPELISPELLDFIGDAEHIAVNVEGPLIGKDAALVQAKEMRLMHTIDPAAVSLLDRIGADIWCLCNNHIMDAGQEGLAESLKLASEHGVKTLGVGKDIREACRPLILDEAGGIGIFSAGYRRGCKPAGEDIGGCLCWNEYERIREIIEGIRSKWRWCVALIHGGEEFTSLPSPYVRRRYLDYLDMGADVVVSHHPHVPMNYEKVGDKIIFYSLGNFIFDTPYQRAQFHTDEGVVLKLHFTENDLRFEACGLKIDRKQERIKKAGLPDIFCEVDREEYERLAPLSAKAFISATKRQQIFLHPEEFTEASEEKWTQHFMDEKRSGRVEGEALDLRILLPFSEEAEKGAWKESRLEKVKEYILGQI